MIIIQSLMAYDYMQVATEAKVGKTSEYCFLGVRMF